MSLVARVRRAVEARAPGTPPRTRRGGVRACRARARPESFGAPGAAPPYLREDSLAAALPDGARANARPARTRRTNASIWLHGYVNGCSSDRHLIYVDRHAGARAVVAGRRLRCSGLMQRRAHAAASRCSCQDFSKAFASSLAIKNYCSGRAVRRCDLDLACCKTLASPGLASRAEFRRRPCSAWRLA